MISTSGSNPRNLPCRLKFVHHRHRKVKDHKTGPECTDRAEGDSATLSSPHTVQPSRCAIVRHSVACYLCVGRQYGLNLTTALFCDEAGAKIRVPPLLFGFVHRQQEPFVPN